MTCSPNYLCLLFGYTILAMVLPAPALHAAPQKRAAFVEPVADPNLPNVLLIGDSISIGYTLPVRQKLQGVANVYRPPVNCGDTRRGVDQIDHWLGDRQWDVIHFNFGLHDLKYVDPKNGQLIAVDAPGARQNIALIQYEKNLETIARRLTQTGAVVIWRPTTPVPEGSNGRVSGDDERYNAVAANVMQRYEGIQIDPVGQLATHPPIVDGQLPANVHYSSQGSDQLADVIAETIRQAITTSSR